MTALNDGREFGKGMTDAFMHEVVIPQNDFLYYISPPPFLQHFSPYFVTFSLLQSALIVYLCEKVN